MLLTKAIKRGIFGIVGWDRISIKHGIALFTSFFDRNTLVVNDLRQRDAPVGRTCEEAELAFCLMRCERCGGG